MPSHQRQFYTADAVQDSPQSTTSQVSKNGHRPGVFWTPDAFLDEHAENLKPYSSLLYIYYRRRADKNGQSWASAERIGKDLNMSDKTVRRANKELEAKKYIEIQERLLPNGGQTTHLITVLPLPMGGASHTEGVDSQSRGVLPESPGGVDSGTTEGIHSKGVHSRRTVQTTNETSFSTGSSRGANESTPRLARDPGQHKEQSNAEFNSRPPRSIETQYSSGAARPAEAEFSPKRVMAVYLEKLAALGVPAPDEAKQKKFLEEFETLAHEKQIDAPTLRAVLRQMLLRAQVPVSPLFAHSDVQKQPEKHPPLSIDDLAEWWQHHRDSLEGYEDFEDSKVTDFFDVDGWEVRYERWYRGKSPIVVLKDGAPWTEEMVPLDEVPEWVRQKIRQMKEDPWNFDDSLLPGQEVV